MFRVSESTLSAKRHTAFLIGVLAAGGEAALHIATVH